MGMNITVRNRTSVEHPDWDWIRYAGDRDFADMVGNLPCIEENWSSPPDYDPHIRPADFAAWRKAISEREWPNPGRFEGLMDILERSPDYWLHFSW